MKNKLLILCCCLLISGIRTSMAQSRNVLILIADDLGVDYMSTYGEGTDFAPTPNINQLASEGVTFTNAWSNPVCSPTRATLLTGRYGFRNGVQTVVGSNDSQTGISLDEYTLPKALDDANSGYAHSCIGKWHLNDASNGDEDNPNLMGFDHFSGLVSGRFDYFDWEKTTNGTTQSVSNYSTTEFVDDAIDWISQQNGPWFQWVAFMSPHTPFHLPPNNLHRFDGLPGGRRQIRRNPIPYFKASIEAMDTEIGRLINYLKVSGQYDNTTIIFIGDNGTTAQVVQAPFDPDRAKGTLYEGGVNVPFIVSGSGVTNPNRTSDALINVADLFATSLELAGVNVNNTLPSNVTFDSKSFLPILQSQNQTIRSWIFSELEGFNTNVDGQTILNTNNYKLIHFNNGSEELYNLSIDPFENNNLLVGNLSGNAQFNYNSLKNTLNDLLGSMTAQSSEVDLIKIKVYPNPASSSIDVDLDNELGDIPKTFELMSENGETLRSGVTTSKQIRIKTTGLDKGLYYLKITGGRHTITERVLIK
ncbi:MAG: sulfatase-like hydrolase/transferase [Bacteroidota bacterium]